MKPTAMFVARMSRGVVARRLIIFSVFCIAGLLALVYAEAWTPQWLLGVGGGLVLAVLVIPATAAFLRRPYVRLDAETCEIRRPTLGYVRLPRDSIREVVYRPRRSVGGSGSASAGDRDYVVLLTNHRKYVVLPLSSDRKAEEFVRLLREGGVKVRRDSN